MLYHRSVFLKESITALNINPNGVYIDGTFGLGGHSKLILSKLTKNGRLIAIDKDLESVAIGRLVMQEDKRFTMIHTSFSKMFTYIQNMELVGSVNGILLDLGLCELQLSNSNRGFSFMKDGWLDMRMDNSIGQTAATWLASASWEKIAWVLKTFGEERFAKQIAKSIVFKRQYKPILRSMELSNIISSTVFRCSNRYNRNKHPATRSFLAIRMYINKELKEVKQILQDILMMLAPKGRLVVISFNSLEDRLVKHFIYKYSRNIPILPKLALTESQLLNFYTNTYQFRNITKLKPTDQDIKQNKRARSAILRCAEKLDTYVNI